MQTGCQTLEISAGPEPGGIKPLNKMIYVLTRESGGVLDRVKKNANRGYFAGTPTHFLTPLGVEPVGQWATIR